MKYNETLKLLDKHIDESRQGEVFSTERANLQQPDRKFYIESYGCQMNFSDSEIVASILKQENYQVSTDYHSADLILLNTCSIRDNAEQRIRNRLKQFNEVKKAIRLPLSVYWAAWPNA